MKHEQSKKWYHRWWVWVILVLGAIVIIGGIVFGLEVRKIVHQLESGELAFEDAIGIGSQVSSDPNANGQDSSVAVSVETTDDPSMGPDDARVVIVAFEDFECPYCERAFPIIREVITKYKDQVKFIYRDFPISSIHSRALPAAEAAECAHAQGKFWEYHDQLFINQRDLSDEALLGYAKRVNLNQALFETCARNELYKSEVLADYQAGQRAGVTGTPTWFINGQKVAGVLPLDVWITIIENELKK